MSAHTPGPWRYYDPLNENRGDENDYFAIESACAPYDMPPINLTSFMKEADARLIAAAPDLLLAVKCLCEEMADYMAINKLGDPNDKHNYRLGMAAIAKAEAAS